MRKAIIHKGEAGCMNVAFYLTEDVKSGDIIKASHVERVDGKQPVKGDPIVCGSCKRNVTVISPEGWCK
jgi:hypothetical protein